MSERLANRSWSAVILLALLATILLALVMSSLHPSTFLRAPLPLYTTP